MPLAAIPAIIGAAAIGGGASIAAGALAGRQSSQEKGLTGQLQANAQQAGQSASQFLTSGKANLDTAQNFWQSIINGNQANTVQQLAGTINPIQSASRQAETSALEFMPRGGGSTEVLSQVPYQRANAVTGAITNLAAQAPNEIAQIGATESGTGASLLGQSSGAAASDLSFLQSNSAQAAQIGSSVGGGIGNLLYYYLNSRAASGGGGGGGGGVFDPMAQWKLGAGSPVEALPLEQG